MTHATTMNAFRNMDVDDLTLRFVNARKKAGEDIAEHHVHSILFLDTLQKFVCMKHYSALLKTAKYLSRTVCTFCAKSVGKGKSVSLEAAFSGKYQTSDFVAVETANILLMKNFVLRSESTP